MNPFPKIFPNSDTIRNAKMVYNYSVKEHFDNSSSDKQLSPKVDPFIDLLQEKH